MSNSQFSKDSNVTNTIATLITTGLLIVAKIVSTVIETMGTQLANGCDGLGNRLTGIPVMRRITHWLGTILSAFFDLIATTLNAIMNVVAHGVAGAVRVIGGGMSRDKRLVRAGLSDMVAGSAGAGIAISGKGVALLQAISFMQWRERSLTPSEKEMLWQVYRGSLRYSNIRVIDGFAGVFSANDRQFVLGNKIYMKNTSPPAYYDRMLVHECCHVWQNQHLGTRYLFDALWAQRRLPNAYSWRNELAQGHTHWREFNKEAQASLLEDIFSKGQQIPPQGIPGEFYVDDPLGENVEFKMSGIDYTALARETVAYIRRAK